VVGSGIMGEQLAGGNVAIGLLANTSATGAALVALILTVGPCRGRTSILQSQPPTPGKAAALWGCSRQRSHAVPFAVAAYITAAYWFTSSTFFANPAVTIGRTMSDTFSGIRPIDARGSIAAQIAGAAVATRLSAGCDEDRHPR
jgi:hypothetical protein